MVTLPSPNDLNIDGYYSHLLLFPFFETQPYNNSENQFIAFVRPNQVEGARIQHSTVDRVQDYVNRLQEAYNEKKISIICLFSTSTKRGLIHTRKVELT